MQISSDKQRILFAEATIWLNSFYIVIKKKSMKGAFDKTQNTILQLYKEEFPVCSSMASEIFSFFVLGLAVGEEVQQGL